MAKLLVLMLAACIFVQASNANNSAEEFNDDLNNQLKVLKKLQEEPESADHINELKKLIAVVEGALKLKSAEEKYQMMDEAYKNFTPEFGKWFNSVEETAIKKYLLK